MKIQRILISQPTPSSEKNPFAELSAKHNVQFDFHPLINIERISLKEFRAQRIDILTYSAAIFTSRTAIDHFFSLAEQARVAIPETFKYFCVTETIALYLQKYIVYRKRKIFFGKGTFCDLMEIVGKHKDLRYLLPLCDQHKAEIPLAMSKTGAQYTKMILSHAVVADLSDINPDQYQMMVFYSPAEVKAMADNIKTKAQQCKIATFGSATASAVFEQNLTVDLAVPTPSMPSMTMAIDKFITACDKNEDIEVFAIRAAKEVTLNVPTLRKTTGAAAAKMRAVAGK